jgi:uncharacterized protein YjbJ (UPF0337 family)
VAIGRRVVVSNHPAIYAQSRHGELLHPEKGVSLMSGKTDVVKGRIKEAAGVLTGNEKLREEGKMDQAVGNAKQTVEKVAGKVKKAVKTALE